jgi:hypothetical protein
MKMVRIEKPCVLSFINEFSLVSSQIVVVVKSFRDIIVQESLPGDTSTLCFHFFGCLGA